MARHPQRDDPLGSREACSVVVIYEDARARERVASVRDYLFRTFVDDLDFEFSWWEQRALADPASAADALKAAVRADVLVFCGSAPGNFDPAVLDWLERFTQGRQAAEGFLLALFAQSPLEPDRVTPKQQGLREIARRSGMEFRADVAVETAGPSEITIGRRAVEVTSVLQQIRGYRPPHQRWGLNE